jgi:hypothetical protein
MTLVLDLAKTLPPRLRTEVRAYSYPFVGASYHITQEEWAIFRSIYFIRGSDLEIRLFKIWYSVQQQPTNNNQQQQNNNVNNAVLVRVTYCREDYDLLILKMSHISGEMSESSRRSQLREWDPGDLDQSEGQRISIGTDENMRDASGTFSWQFVLH